MNIKDNTAKRCADAVLMYLADQTYVGEPILHVIAACDYVSREHMARALEKVILKELES